MATTSDRKLDRVRPEGSYVRTESYVGTDLYIIERVDGNCTVDSVTLTHDEAINVLTCLQDILKSEVKEN